MPTEPIRARRAVFAALVAAICAAPLWLAAAVLGAGGWTVWEVLIFGCLAANIPLLALPAASALIGFVVRVAARDPARAVLPVLGLVHDDDAITLRTAIAVCLRNEDTAAVLAPLERLLGALAATDAADRFTVWLLSDTAEPAAVAAEAAAIARFAARHVGPDGTPRVAYRRRARNTGFKAGNVMDFADGPGRDYDLMLVLDADSEMTAPFVLRLVRIMQADPRLGCVQPTISGRPATALFSRLFGFGNRQGARLLATGQAWWQGDQGPFWGHNGILRIAPFREHCRLLPLPDGTHVLSHDHVEAARLHSAGWKVRMLPEDAGSRERHPPSLPEFLRRDLRWARGNWQYRFLLRDPALSAMGRYKLVEALLFYAVVPLWFAMLPLAALNVALGGAGGTPRGALLALLALGYGIVLAPRLLGYAEVLVRRGQLAAYGGLGAFTRAMAAEMPFSLMFDALWALHTVFVIATVLGGGGDGWISPHRSERSVPWSEAAAMLWPHTLVGLLLAALFATGGLFALLVSLPVTAGLILAIPFAVLTADPTLSARLARARLAAMPEELAGTA